MAESRPRLKKNRKRQGSPLNFQNECPKRCKKAKIEKIVDDNMFFRLMNIIKSVEHQEKASIEMSEDLVKLWNGILPQQYDLQIVWMKTVCKILSSRNYGEEQFSTLLRVLIEILDNSESFVWLRNELWLTCDLFKSVSSRIRWTEFWNSSSEFITSIVELYVKLMHLCNKTGIENSAFAKNIFCENLEKNMSSLVILLHLGHENQFLSKYSSIIDENVRLILRNFLFSRCQELHGQYNLNRVFRIASFYNKKIESVDDEMQNKSDDEILELAKIYSIPFVLEEFLILPDLSLDYKIRCFTALMSPISHNNNFFIYHQVLEILIRTGSKELIVLYEKSNNICGLTKSRILDGFFRMEPSQRSNILHDYIQLGIFPPSIIASSVFEFIFSDNSLRRASIYSKVLGAALNLLFSIGEHLKANEMLFSYMNRSQDQKSIKTHYLSTISSCCDSLSLRNLLEIVSFSLQQSISSDSLTNESLVFPYFQLVVDVLIKRPFITTNDNDLNNFLQAITESANMLLDCDATKRSQLISNTFFSVSMRDLCIYLTINDVSSLKIEPFLLFFYPDSNGLEVLLENMSNDHISLQLKSFAQFILFQTIQHQRSLRKENFQLENIFKILTETLLIIQENQAFHNIFLTSISKLLSVFFTQTVNDTVFTSIISTIVFICCQTLENGELCNIAWNYDCTGHKSVLASSTISETICRYLQLSFQNQIPSNVSKTLFIINNLTKTFPLSRMCSDHILNLFELISENAFQYLSLSPNNIKSLLNVLKDLSSYCCQNYNIKLDLKSNGNQVSKIYTVFINKLLTIKDHLTEIEFQIIKYIISDISCFALTKSSASNEVLDKYLISLESSVSLMTNTSILYRVLCSAISSIFLNLKTNKKAKSMTSSSYQLKAFTLNVLKRIQDSSILSSLEEQFIIFTNLFKLYKCIELRSGSSKLPSEDISLPLAQFDRFSKRFWEIINNSCISPDLLPSDDSKFVLSFSTIIFYQFSREEDMRSFFMFILKRPEILFNVVMLDGYPNDTIYSMLHVFLKLLTSIPSHENCSILKLSTWIVHFNLTLSSQKPSILSNAALRILDFISYSYLSTSSNQDSSNSYIAVLLNALCHLFEASRSILQECGALQKTLQVSRFLLTPSSPILTDTSAIYSISRILGIILQCRNPDLYQLFHVYLEIWRDCLFHSVQIHRESLSECFCINSSNSKFNDRDVKKVQDPLPLIIRIGSRFSSHSEIKMFYASIISYTLDSMQLKSKDSDDIPHIHPQSSLIVYSLFSVMNEDLVKKMYSSLSEESKSQFTSLYKTFKKHIKFYGN